MRRTAVLLALATAAAGAVPALAGTTALPADQAVAGTITAPVPANVTGGPRRAALVSTATNGLVGHFFTVDAATVGGAFDLKKLADPTGQGDLNIVFYSDAGDAGAGAPTAVGEFSAAQVGGEKGLVPEGAKSGLVFISGGARVGFDYKAVPATAVALAGESLDATVAAGQPVRFVNDTAGPLAVVATDLDESDTPLFDTGELAPGGAATVVLTEPGTYAFTAGERTGTLTVTS